LSLGASKTASILTQGQNELVHLIVQLCIWISLAVGLRFFVNWNPRSIFSQTARTNE
jgi:hypothetical protein